MLTEDQISDLKAKHGNELVAFETPNGDLVFKKPTRIIWTDFVAAVSKDNANREAAMRRLSLACVVKPEPQEAALIFDAYPALPAKVTEQLAELAGTSDTFEAKKL